MAIVSINYNKVHAEKNKKQSPGQISIRNNVSITNISLGNMRASDKQKAIVVDFSFSITYDPIGLISIDGSIVDIEEEAKAKDFIDVWEKHKRVEKDLTTKVITVVLEKCTIKAMILSQDIGLPSPVPLPRIKINNETLANGPKEEKKESKKEETKKEESKKEDNGKKDKKK
jgi:hypothetical protein